MHSDEDPYPIEFDEFPGNVLSSKGFVEEDDYNNVEEEENDEENDDDFEDADYDPVDLAGRKNRRLAGATGAKSKKVRARVGIVSETGVAQRLRFITHQKILPITPITTPTHLLSEWGLGRQEGPLRWEESSHSECLSV